MYGVEPSMLPCVKLLSIGQGGNEEVAALCAALLDHAEISTCRKKRGRVVCPNKWIRIVFMCRGREGSGGSVCLLPWVELRDRRQERESKLQALIEGEEEEAKREGRVVRLFSAMQRWFIESRANEEEKMECELHCAGKGKRQRQLQDNINLFCHARNCILSILNCMSSMPGIMRQMPPLPISLNEELLYSIFLSTSQVQTYMCGSRSDSDVKQKPSCSNILHESNPL